MTSEVSPDEEAVVLVPGLGTVGDTGFTGKRVFGSLPLPRPRYLLRLLKRSLGSVGVPDSQISSLFGPRLGAVNDRAH